MDRPESRETLAFGEHPRFGQQKCEVHWLVLRGDRYEPVEHSGLIEFGPAELAERIVSGIAPGGAPRRPG